MEDLKVKRDPNCYYMVRDYGEFRVLFVQKSPNGPVLLAYFCKEIIETDKGFILKGVFDIVESIYRTKRTTLNLFC
jgi:hypothetical protein